MKKSIILSLAIGFAVTSCEGLFPRAKEVQTSAKECTPEQSKAIAALRQEMGNAERAANSELGYGGYALSSKKALETKLAAIAKGAEQLKNVNCTNKVDGKAESFVGALNLRSITNKIAAVKALLSKKQ